VNLLRQVWIVFLRFEFRVIAAGLVVVNTLLALVLFLEIPHVGASWAAYGAANAAAIGTVLSPILGRRAWHLAAEIG